jgi:hypothetical protein
MISVDKLSNLTPLGLIPEQESELRICIPVLYLPREELIAKIKQLVGPSWVFSNGVLSYFTFHDVSEKELRGVMQYMESNQVPYDIVKVFSYRPHIGNALALVSPAKSCKARVPSTA